jgi:hypothetical protein
MPLNIINQITDYERYNIYVLPCKDTSLLEVAKNLETRGFPVINVGKSLAKYLANIKKAKHLHLEAEDQFKKLIETNSKKVSEVKPPVVAIFNLGILFEELVSIDAAKIIKELSKSFAIIIIWDEQIESSAILHWDVQKDTIQLNFTDTHLKQVNIPYEI